MVSDASGEFARRLARPRPGGVILFTGAGFSDKAKNLSGNTIPFAKEFAATLAQQLGESESISLDVISDIYETTNPGKKFINLIVDTFTSSSFEKFHSDILKYPWKRIYTTNYDDVAELVIGRRSVLPTVFTRDTLPLSLSRNELQIVHLNGYVKFSNSHTVVDDFSLTLTKYVESSLFDSRWATLLRQDFQLADTIVFAGYSMYDLDISRILTTDPEIKAKTFVIQHDGISKGNELQLKRFGQVLSIGLSGFASIISKALSDGISSTSASLENFRECLAPLAPEIYTVRTRDIELLLERGVCDERIIYSKKDKNSSPYTIDRNLDNQILNSIKEENSTVVVHADIGNGKSVLIEHVKMEALRQGYRIFELASVMENLSYDIEYINNVEEKFIIIIEDLITYRDIIDTMKERVKKYRILSTVRSSVFEVKISDIKSILGPEFITVDANILDKDDYKDLTEILTKGGYWGELHSHSQKDKYKYIEKKMRLSIKISIAGLA